MKIRHESGDTKGAFIIENNGQDRGRLSYSKAGDTLIIIDHTEVSEELRGENAGRKLVEYAVEYARNGNLKVIPLCPFAKSIIERDSSLQDVLKR